MSRNVLVIAAHPDDETFGVGGTIARHAAHGDRVTMLILTDGVTARHAETGPQKEAARRAIQILGARQVYFGELPDQRLDSLPLLEVIRPISQLIRDLRPEWVYTHHRGDANQDHRATFAATLVAVRPVEGSLIERVLCYEVASSTEWGPPYSEWAFIPNLFVDVGATLETKLQAVDAYRDTFESEVKPFPHPRSPEAVRIYAQNRGTTAGIPAAEAFVLMREIVRGSTWRS